MIPNAFNISQNKNDKIFINSLENYINEVKIFEELHNVSNQVSIPAEYIEEYVDIDLLIRNNVIFIKRVVDKYKLYIDKMEKNNSLQWMII